MNKGAAPLLQLPSNWFEARRAIEREFGKCVRRQEEPAFPSLLLIAPDGGVWRVTVDDAGVLSTEPVPR